MSESKCQINGNKIEPCAALAQFLEHDAEYTTRKGLLKYKIYNHELIHSQDLIMLRSGEFSKSPIRLALLMHCWFIRWPGLYCRWWTLVIQARVKYESCRSHQTP
ncbi:hypothetical protein ACWWTW_004176 [Escherichia coli]